MTTNQLYRWCFTINDPRKEAEVGLSQDQDRFLPSHLLQRIIELGLDSKDWIFQLERGEKGRLHYQGALSLRKKARKSELLSRFRVAYNNMYSEADTGLTVEQIFKNTTILPMMGSKEEAWKYCQKEDSQVKGPWSKETKGQYNGEDLPAREDFYNYQQYVLAMFEQHKKKPLADREVYWLYDPIGNTGKSVLTKYLLWKHGSDVMIVPRANAQNMRTVIIDRGPKLLYLFDLPRTLGREEHKEDIYSVIEDVKNGTVLSAMYGRDAQLLMYPPIVWVFSNYRPEVESLSLDRWVILRMRHDMSLEIEKPVWAISPGNVNEPNEPGFSK
jgi:hypothetical protein